jgi:trigger factor
VKLRLALEKIAAVEAIVPTADELNAEYAKIAESYKMDVEKVKVMIAEEDLALDVAVEKAMNLVVESAAVAE